MFSLCTIRYVGLCLFGLSSIAVFFPPWAALELPAVADGIRGGGGRGGGGGGGGGGTIMRRFLLTLEGEGGGERPLILSLFPPPFSSSLPSACHLI